MHGTPATWLRRAVTIPGLVGLWLVVIAASPIVLLGALGLDLANRRKLASVRFLLAVAFALTIHVLGLLLLLAGWLVGTFAGAARALPTSRSA